MIVCSRALRFNDDSVFAFVEGLRPSFDWHGDTNYGAGTYTTSEFELQLLFYLICV